MKKILKFVKTLSIISLLIISLITIINLNVSKVFAIDVEIPNYNTDTDSNYVKTVTDLETTDVGGGVTLYEQKLSSLLNGDPGKTFYEHYVQWVDLKSYNENGIKIVTWTNQSADSWTATTTRGCAMDWERHHPGWIVLAGINGDFFQNSGTITWEPTNNFMADGDMYRADIQPNSSYRAVLGFTDNNEVIAGAADISGLKLQLMSDDNTVLEEFDFAGYNKAPGETGIYLYTKDATSKFDLTGYTVYEGKYTMCRVSNGSNKTVFVKGAITGSRAGTTDEIPCETRKVLDENGSENTVITREFYIATKDASYQEKLTNGTLVRCQHNYQGKWASVTQSVGYIYQMLDNGNSLHQMSTDSFVYTNHPRTFIGFKEDGTPVMMVVDGRGKTAAEKNYGVSLFEGAELMKLAGCVSAYNLDGGGSSTLIVRNVNGEFEVINRPSDGSERSTGNAVFLVMRDPAVESTRGNSTATTVKIDKKIEKMNKLVCTKHGLICTIERKTTIY